MIYWLTGNTNAGKTTVAINAIAKLQVGHDMLPILLDGNQMRKAISPDCGFSEADRRKHCLRVARLAEILSSQGHTVIVAVIAPYRILRDDIEKICMPLWIHVTRKEEGGENRPYEDPIIPFAIINNSKLNEREAAYLLRDIILEQEEKDTIGASAAEEIGDDPDSMPEGAA